MHAKICWLPTTNQYTRNLANLSSLHNKCNLYLAMRHMRLESHSLQIEKEEQIDSNNQPQKPKIHKQTVDYQQ